MQLARPHWWWTPVRVLLAVTTVVLAIGMLQRGPCMSTGWLDESVRYGRMCYSDVPYLFSARGFVEQVWPYDPSSTYPAMEYPPVISYGAWLASLVMRWLSIGSGLNTYFVITALMLVLAALAATWFLAGVTADPMRALPFALSPVLLLEGFINWDLLAVTAIAAALWAWARGRPVLAGLAIGLGTATKLYPLFLLGGVLIICWRERRWRDFMVTTATAVAAWLVANAPAYLSSAERWKLFWTFNSERGVDLGSLWLVASHGGHTASIHLLNQVSWVFFGAACLAVLVLGLRAPRTPSLAQIGFLVVAAFLLVNKVYSPQYALWLLPLAVLARPRWRDLLIWQACEVLYFGAVWLYLGNWLLDASGQSSPFYDVAVVVRVLGELYLMALVARDIWRGESWELKLSSPRSGQTSLR